MDLTHRVQEEICFDALHEKGYIEVDANNIAFFIDSMQYFSGEVCTILTVHGKAFLRFAIDSETQHYDTKESFIRAGDTLIPWRYPIKGRLSK